MSLGWEGSRMFGIVKQWRTYWWYGCKHGGMVVGRSPSGRQQHHMLAKGHSTLVGFADSPTFRGGSAIWYPSIYKRSKALQQESRSPSLIINVQAALAFPMIYFIVNVSTHPRLREHLPDNSYIHPSQRCHQPAFWFLSSHLHTLKGHMSQTGTAKGKT